MAIPIPSNAPIAGVDWKRSNCRGGDGILAIPHKQTEPSDYVAVKELTKPKPLVPTLSLASVPDPRLCDSLLARVA